MRLAKLLFISLVMCLICTLTTSCGSNSDDDKKDTEKDDAGTDDDNNDDTNDDDTEPMPDFIKKQVSVFDIPVVATEDVSSAALLHVASILGEYLDSDEDGTPNNSTVTTYMAENHAIMAVFADEDEIDSVDFGDFPGEGDHVVTVLASDIIMASPSADDGFDPTLEEVMHLVTSNGYALVYPDELGEKQGTDIANAMDEARGGTYTDIPDAYPDDAWYTYYDDSCDYKCQVTEYTYWGLSSILGAQDYDGRLEQIESEWALNTEAKVQATDETLYNLLTSSTFSLPTALPDGDYDGADLTVEEL